MSKNTSTSSASTATSAPKKKGTSTTEAIIGTAANKMQSATKALVEAYEIASKMGPVIEENTLKVLDLETKIAELKVQYQQLRAQHQFDLDLEFKKDEKTYVDGYLNENGLVSIPGDELNDLKAQIEKLRTDYDADLKKAIASATAAVQKDYENRIAIKNAESKAAEAETNATIKQQSLHITELNKQVDMWREQLDQERKASTERAKAASIGTLNVTPGGK